MERCLKAFNTSIFRPRTQADARKSCLHALSLVPARRTGRCFDDMMRSRAVCMAIYAGALDNGVEKALGIPEKEWVEAMGEALISYLPEVDFSNDPKYAPAARPLTQSTQRLPAQKRHLLTLEGQTA